MENLNKKIGEAIELERKIKRKTRKDLGKEIGVCYQQIQNYETGNHNIHIVRLFEIAKALGVSILKLLPSELIGNKK